MLFAAPPEQSLVWSDHGIEGIFRFLKRVWAFAHQQADIIRSLNQNHAQNINWEEAHPKLIQMRCELHKIMQKANNDYDKLRFNTVASACMKIMNLINLFQHLNCY